MHACVCACMDLVVLKGEEISAKVCVCVCVCVCYMYATICAFVCM